MKDPQCAEEGGERNGEIIWFGFIKAVWEGVGEVFTRVGKLGG